MNLNHRLRLSILTLMVMGIFGAESLQATPRFALETGSTCITCHANPTGGGMRNDYGQGFAIDEIPMDLASDWAAPWPGGFVTDWLRVGAEFRVQALNYQAADGSRKSPLFAMQSDIYGQILMNDQVDVVFKTGLDPAYATPEFWLRLLQSESDNYIRAGRFQPNYGLRLDDHTAYIRGGDLRLSQSGFGSAGLSFSPMTPKPTAVEVGFFPGSHFQFTASLANRFIKGASPAYGFNESLGEKNFAIQGGYWTEWGPIGVAVFGNFMQEDEITLAGSHWGLTWLNFTWLGEVDWAMDYITAGQNSQAVFQELTYTLLQGLAVSGRYEHFDPDLSSASGSLSRVDVGLNLFPTSFGEIQFHLRWPMVEQNGEISTAPMQGILQFHTWF
ncbi:MAG: hypothetical protein K9M19_08100 [Candidatus Marinimicrobia bacterium]|nr:hypothetical protein [Candidatus Neomarinimicrobiota bacterium]